MSDTTGSLPFNFYTYGTTKGGCIVGKVYEDHETGKKFRFCQAHTTLVSTVLVSTATQFDPVVQVGTATWGLATDDVSAGVSATNPICLGVPTSACPVSTSSITYYFWAQTDGPIHTTLTGSTYAAIKMNNDDDAAIGDGIIMTSTDASCNTIAGSTGAQCASTVGYCLVAVTAATNLVSGVYAKSGA